MTLHEVAGIMFTRVAKSISPPLDWFSRLGSLLSKKVVVWSKSCSVGLLSIVRLHPIVGLIVSIWRVEVFLELELVAK